MVPVFFKFNIHLRLLHLSGERSTITSLQYPKEMTSLNLIRIEVGC